MSKRDLGRLDPVFYRGCAVESTLAVASKTTFERLKKLLEMDTKRNAKHLK